MCNIHISLRIAHTETLLKASPGVYHTYESLRDYWKDQTGIYVETSHVPATLARIQSNGLTPIHQRGKTVCFETEEIRTARMAEEKRIKEAKLQAQAEKDNVVWAKKRQKVQDLLAALREAQDDLKAYEDAKQDSILRVA